MLNKLGFILSCELFLYLVFVAKCKPEGWEGVAVFNTIGAFAWFLGRVMTIELEATKPTHTDERIEQRKPYEDLR